MKMPLPTKTASAPSCMTKLASAGVAIPPAEKFGTGGFHDFANLPGRGHAGDAAFGADLRGHALEGHDRDSSRFLSDDGLLGVADVHDHAAFAHLGEAGLEAEGS